MRRFIGSTFIVIGTLSVLLAVFAAIGSVIALSERIRFGRGLMFADVELLTALTLFLGVLGVALLWCGRRLKRPDRQGAG